MRKNIFVIGLAAVTLVVVIAYILTLRKQVIVLEEEKGRLAQALSEAKESERKLSALNLKLKDNLGVYRNKITKLLAEKTVMQESFEDLRSRFSLLEAENKTLREENESFKARSEGGTGIKNALGELKRQTLKVCRQIRQKVNENKLMEGNRGYMIKEGKSTFPEKVKIEVVPAPEK